MPAPSCASVISTTPPCAPVRTADRRRTAASGAGATRSRRPPHPRRRPSRARLSPPPSPAPPQAPAAPTRTFRRSGARLAFGKSVTVAEDEEVTDGVVAIGGNVRIAGRVRDEVVALGGDVELLPTADVRGDITVDRRRGPDRAGRPARRLGRSRRRRCLARRLGWPALRWSWIDLGGTARWLTLAGTMTRVALLALAMAAVILLARGRVGRIAAAAAAAPLRAGLIGLAVQVLFVPALVVISVVLAITIIGIPFVALVVPLALSPCSSSRCCSASPASPRPSGPGWPGALGWEQPPAVWMAVLGLALIVLPTLLSRLVGVAPEALRAVRVRAARVRHRRRVRGLDDRPGRRGDDRPGPLGHGPAAASPPLPAPSYDTPSAL